MTQHIDVTADPDEIVQAEEHEDARPVTVNVSGPVQTRELPSRQPGYKTDQGVTATAPVKVLPFEARRKSAVIIAISQDIWIGASQASVLSGAAGAMRWPAVVPYVVDHMEEVWVAAVSGTTDVGCESRFWSQ